MCEVTGKDSAETIRDFIIDQERTDLILGDSEKRQIIYQQNPRQRSILSTAMSSIPIAAPYLGITVQPHGYHSDRLR